MFQFLPSNPRERSDDCCALDRPTSSIFGLMSHATTDPSASDDDPLPAVVGLATDAGLALPSSSACLMARRTRKATSPVPLEGEVGQRVGKRVGPEMSR